MAKDDLESSTGGRNVPQTHKLPINIRQPQGVSLMMWVPPWVRAAAAHVGDAVAAVARLRPGRPPEYDHAAIAKVAEDLARETGVDDHLDPFCVRVRDECKNKRLRIKMPKSRSQMRKICRPTWESRTRR
jgi:hypothetical protein